MNVSTGNLILPFAKRLWHSRVAMTWCSQFVRLLSIVVVIPFVLKAYDANTAAVWFLLSVIYGLVLVADFGLVSTFGRLISYAMGGASVRQLEKLNSLSEIQINHPNVEAVKEIVATMRRFYLGVMLVSGLALAIGGWLALSRPIGLLENQFTGRIASGWVFGITLLSVWGQSYVAFLHGINQIAAQRRWEMLVGLGQLFSVCSLLLNEAGFLYLVMVFYSWHAFGVILNAWLSRSFDSFGAYGATSRPFNGEVAVIAWPRVWRSGLGILFSLGAVQATGLIYAQFADSRAISSYLVHLRFIQAISAFAQAPFYTKLPRMGQLVAGHRFDALRRLADRGFLLTFCGFACGFLIVAVTADYMLPLIWSDAKIFDPLLWALMGLAFFFERFGNMHMAVYSLSNKIIWHIMNSITGSIFILLSIILFSKIGVYAFPVSLMISYLCFHCLVSGWLSHHTFGIKFPSFELRTTLGPLLLLIVYALLTVQPGLVFGRG